MRAGDQQSFEDAFTHVSLQYTLIFSGFICGYGQHTCTRSLHMAWVPLFHRPLGRPSGTSVLADQVEVMSHCLRKHALLLLAHHSDYQGAPRWQMCRTCASGDSVAASFRKYSYSWLKFDPVCVYFQRALSS